MLPLTCFVALSSPWRYTTDHIAGWTLKIDQAAMQDKPLYEAANQEITRQLQAVARVVPDDSLAKLRKIILYVNWKTDTACMAFHPGADWLREHKMDPEMTGNVEIGSVKNFVSWTYEQPWMILHEMAHAYHNRFLDRGFDNADVLTAFSAAMKSKRYEQVLHWDGKTVKHYATTNQMEFFAETTEAYFGSNDFYPFVRAELMTFDREAFSLMERAWGKPTKRFTPIN